LIAKKRGRYKEAEKYYLRSLEIIEKVYGNNHPKVAIIVDNLGTFNENNVLNHQTLTS
jgi:hypothetical protein